VPVYDAFIVAGNKCDFYGSWEIAEYSGRLGTIDVELKKVLDEELGPLSRQMAYYHILRPSNYALWSSLCTNNRHWLWRLVWWAFAADYLTKNMRKVL
jgi:hypothetical protein